MGDIAEHVVPVPGLGLEEPGRFATVDQALARPRKSSIEATSGSVPLFLICKPPSMDSWRMFSSVGWPPTSPIPP